MVLQCFQMALIPWDTGMIMNRPVLGYGSILMATSILETSRKDREVATEL